MAVGKLPLVSEMDWGNFITATSLKLKLNLETVPLTEAN